MCAGLVVPHQPRRKPAAARNRAAGDAILTFGKHKGARLADVPADYLAWAYDNIDWPWLRSLIARYRRERLAEQRERKRQRNAGKSARAGIAMRTMHPPYAAIHPVLADTKLDSTERCPFDSG